MTAQVERHAGVVQVVYGRLSQEEATKGGSGYAFRISEPVAVGDLVEDCGQICTVVGFGRHGYTGPVRDIRRSALDMDRANAPRLPVAPIPPVQAPPRPAPSALPPYTQAEVERVKERWNGPEWQRIRKYADSPKIKALVDASPITPVEAAQLRELLPPIADESAAPCTHPRCQEFAVCQFPRRRRP